MVGGRWEERVGGGEGRGGIRCGLWMEPTISGFPWNPQTVRALLLTPLCGPGVHCDSLPLAWSEVHRCQHEQLPGGGCENPASVLSRRCCTCVHGVESELSLLWCCVLALRADTEQYSERQGWLRESCQGARIEMDRDKTKIFQLRGPCYCCKISNIKISPRYIPLKQWRMCSL